MESDVLITLVLGLLDRAVTISELLQRTRAEGREPSAAELEALDVEFATARPGLVDAIAKAKAEGR